MNIEKIIRAWSDEEYRASLSSEELALLPENPVGLIELDDATLRGIVGGGQSYDFSLCYTACAFCSFALCSGYGCTQPCYCSSCSFISCC